jgi:hypothetical protein
MPERAYQIAAGVVLLIVLTIAYGGTFVLGVTRGNVPANELQRRFFRAGHAHAGVLVILGLLALTLEQLNHVRAPYPAISFGILAAAVLMPAGFFLSVIGPDPARPGRAIGLLWSGAAALAIGLISAGVGLIAATPSLPHVRGRLGVLPGTVSRPEWCCPVPCGRAAWAAPARTGRNRVG